MGRFILGLLVAGLAFWGYDSWFADARADRTGPTETFDDVGVTQGSEVGTAAPEPEPDPEPVTQTDDTSSVRGPRPAALDASKPDEISALINGIERGDSAAQRRAFTVLRRLAGADRRRLSEALMARVQAAESSTALVDLLGPTNAFLHSEEGRRVAGEAIRRCRTRPKAEAIEDTNRLLEACMRGPLERGDAAARAVVDAVNDQHGRLVRQVVFDPSDPTRSKRYKVQAGDSLSGIASHFRRSLGVKLEAGTLAAINRITNPNALQIGQVLRIPVDSIHTVVARESFLMAVYLGDHIVRLYWIAHGKDGHDTPQTTFTVGKKVERPDWHHDGRIIPYGSPENPLGTHFVKFRHESFSGFGVHGTDEPASICTRASLGCIRLGADDIVEFFRLVPRGSEIEIR